MTNSDLTITPRCKTPSETKMPNQRGKSQALLAVWISKPQLKELDKSSASKQMTRSEYVRHRLFQSDESQQSAKSARSKSVVSALRRGSKKA